MTREDPTKRLKLLQRRSIGGRPMYVQPLREGPFRTLWNAFKEGSIRKIHIFVAGPSGDAFRYDHLERSRSSAKTSPVVVFEESWIDSKQVPRFRRKVISPQEQRPGDLALVDRLTPKPHAIICSVVAEDAMLMPTGETHTMGWMLELQANELLMPNGERTTWTSFHSAADAKPLSSGTPTVGARGTGLLVRGTRSATPAAGSWTRRSC